MDDKTTQIIDILQRRFPDAKSELNFNSPFELLVAVILSAQCTDKRVNEVTPALFAVADTPQKMAELPLPYLEQLIHSCGFYHNKALFLHNMSKALVERYNGQVPNDLQSLRTLDGVGRKTANVVYAVAFGGDAIAVDTHVFRVTNRLGIVNAKNVEDTERQLMDILPKDSWSRCHHYFLLHGRYVCKSQRPMCHECELNSLCQYFKTNGDNAGAKRK